MDCFSDLPSALKTVVIPAQPSAPPLPLILPDFVRQSTIDRHLAKVGVMPDLGVYEVDECLSGPSGILFTPDRKIIVAPDLAGRYFSDTIRSALVKADMSNLIVAAYNGKLPVSDFADDGICVSLGTTGYAVYGHWLLDILPRAWCFRRYADLTGLDLRSVRYLLPAATPQWAFTMLRTSLGIDMDQVVLLQDRVLTRLKHLRVPSLLRAEDLMSSELNDFVSQVFARISEPRPRVDLPGRVFISRQNVKSLMDRSTANDMGLERIAEQKGYTLLNPASMSWTEQISLFRQAKVVVGPFGSGMHNTIFSPPSTVSLVLGAAHMNWFQTCISALRQQRMAYIFPTKEERLDGKLSVEYDETVFADALERLEQPL